MRVEQVSNSDAASLRQAGITGSMDGSVRRMDESSMASESEMVRVDEPSQSEFTDGSHMVRVDDLGDGGYNQEL